MIKKVQKPLFIVGLSRSGTKLVRDLLNNHIDISIPEFETHFIPDLISVNKNKFDLEKSLKVVLESDIAQKYLPNVELNTSEIRSYLNTKQFRVEYFLEYILKLFASIEIEDTSTIWGDKTPKNLRHLAELKSIFPSCRILHIIRDPRDRCISVKNTWFKSIYRSAYLWKKEMNLYQGDKLSSYLEIKYEDLISQPELVVKEICEFLDVDFNLDMIKLEKPSEKHGKTSGAKKVVPSNKNKYLSYNKKSVKLIEEITFHTMKSKGYEPVYANQEIKLSKSKLFLLRIYDAIVFKIANLIKGY